MSKTDKLNILDILGGDKATQKEVAELFSALLKSLKDIKTDLTAKITKAANDTNVADTSLSQRITELAGRVENASKDKKWENLYQELSSDVEQLKSANPADLSSEISRLNERFSAWKNPTAEEIRDLLESLIGEDRLDRSMINGLDGILTQPDLDRAISILDKRTQYLINKAGGSGTVKTIVAGTGISVDSTDPANPVVTSTASGTGTVTSVSVATANGVSGSVATATTTPVITITLGAITPTSVNSPGTLTGSNFSGSSSGTNTGDQTSTAGLSNTTNKNLITDAQLVVLGNTSGTNTGDQTSVSGNAGTATKLATARTLFGSTAFDGSAPITDIIASTFGGTGNGFTKFTGPTTSEKTFTLPNANATLARTDAAQTFTGTQTFSQIITTSNAIAASSNAATVPITSRINTVTNNSAATLTITMTTASAVDGQLSQVRVLDFSAVVQTITWVNTENGEATAPTTSNGSTTLPRAVLFQFNSGTSKWRCIAS